MTGVRLPLASPHMKYKIGDKFTYQISAKSSLNGKILTIVSSTTSGLGTMYLGKIGCCQRIAISEEKLDTMELIIV